MVMSFWLTFFWPTLYIVVHIVDRTRTAVPSAVLGDSGIEVCGSTRTRGYGSGTGRCRTRTGLVRVRRPRMRVYPFLPVKNTIFHDVEAILHVFFYFFLLKVLLTIKVKTIAV